MGTKSPDRIPAVEWRRQAETVGEMVEHHWRVRTYCPTCHGYLETPLKLLAQTLGPDVSLWNRRQRCRRLLHGGAVPCTGLVSFEGLPLPCTSWFNLAADWPQGKNPLPPGNGDTVAPTWGRGGARPRRP